MMAEISTETPIWLALNMSKVLNKEESFDLMDKVGPRVCITTATHPGFVGFMANIQTGVLPLAGRYGGGSIHMEKTLNPIRNYQYTIGFLGYMILKQVGVCALGSFMLDPVSMGETLQTLGANPPMNPKPLFGTLDAMPSQPEYLIHSEWDTTEMAQVGFAKVLVNHNIRKIHDDGVMAHLIRGPYIMFFQPMMEESGWRSFF